MKLILLQGYASGSFGPTTAGRMDSYVEQFQAAGGSKIMLAKGNRSKQVVHTYYTKKNSCYSELLCHDQVKCSRSCTKY